MDTIVSQKYGEIKAHKEILRLGELGYEIKAVTVDSSGVTSLYLIVAQKLIERDAES